MGLQTQIYIDASAGAAGDMLLAAALEVLAQIDRQRLDAWKLTMEPFFELEPGIRMTEQRVKRAGFDAAKIDFYVGEIHSDHHHSGINTTEKHDHHDHHDHHHHDHHHGHDHHAPHVHGRNLRDIIALIESKAAEGRLSLEAKTLAQRIFTIIGEAEAKVHGVTLESVHFHEVGAIDSILDIVGFAVAWDLLKVTDCSASAITLGVGKIQIAHGEVSVPPPAVVEIVRQFGLPTTGIEYQGECATPTGVGCIAAVVREFRAGVPGGLITARGVGAGNRDFHDRANIVQMLAIA
jgi:uncharacterized protein (DUF111 family)